MAVVRVGRRHPRGGGTGFPTTRDGVGPCYSHAVHHAWERPDAQRRARRHVSDPAQPSHRPAELATDLVEYFVVVLPDRAALGGVVPAVTEMVRSQRIRVLELVVLARGPDGAPGGAAAGEAEDLAALRELEGATGLPSEHAVRRA